MKVKCYHFTASLRRSLCGQRDMGFTRPLVTMGKYVFRRWFIIVRRPKKIAKRVCCKTCLRIAEGWYKGYRKEIELKRKTT